MATLSYLVGDATQPVGTGTRIIAHVVNTVGAWGAGFVTALSRRWPEPERLYRYLHSRKRLSLGTIHTAVVDTDLIVANLVAQRGLPSPQNPRPLDYSALANCLTSLADLAITLNASVHAPRLGAGLARGEWSQIELLLLERVVQRGVPVTIYDLPTSR